MYAKRKHRCLTFSAFHLQQRGLACPDTYTYSRAIAEKPVASFSVSRHTLFIIPPNAIPVIFLAQENTLWHFTHSIWTRDRDGIFLSRIDYLESK
jgi:hypothetical protein